MLRVLMEKEEATVWALKQIHPALRFKHARMFQEVVAMQGEAMQGEEPTSEKEKVEKADIKKRVGKYTVIVALPSEFLTVYMNKDEMMDFDLYMRAVRDVKADFDQIKHNAWQLWTSIREGAACL